MPNWLTIALVTLALLIALSAWRYSGAANAQSRPPSWYLADYGPNGYEAPSADLCERMADYATAYINNNPKIEKALNRLAPSVGPVIAHRKLHEQLTPGMRRLSLMSILDYNVENGGIFQFFYNSGELEQQVSAALGELKANRLKSAFDIVARDAIAHIVDFERAFKAAAEHPPERDGTPSVKAHEAYEVVRLKLEHSTKPFDDAYNSNPAIGATAAADSIRGEMCRAMVAYIEAHRDEFEVRR